MLETNFCGADNDMVIGVSIFLLSFFLITCLVWMQFLSYIKLIFILHYTLTALCFWPPIYTTLNRYTPKLIEMVLVEA